MDIFDSVFTLSDLRDKPPDLPNRYANKTSNDVMCDGNYHLTLKFTASSTVFYVAV